MYIGYKKSTSTVKTAGFWENETNGGVDCLYSLYV